MTQSSKLHRIAGTSQERIGSSSDGGDDSDYSSRLPPPTSSPPASPSTTAKKGATISPPSKWTASPLNPSSSHVPPSLEARATSPPASKRRDKKTNAEASKLRNHISMTEYEVQRLQKSLKKRNVNLQALEAQPALSEENQQAVLDYNSEIQALHTQIGRLAARQQDYKNEYFNLTGAFDWMSVAVGAYFTSACVW